MRPDYPPDPPGPNLTRKKENASLPPHDFYFTSRVTDRDDLKVEKRLGLRRSAVAGVPVLEPQALAFGNRVSVGSHEMLEQYGWRVASSLARSYEKHAPAERTATLY